MVLDRKLCKIKINLEMQKVFTLHILSAKLF